MNLIAFLRKNVSCLILMPNANNACKSPVYFRNLSTSIESQPCINHNISNILVRKHSFAPEFASRLASNLFHVKNPEKAGLILSFMKESGFSDSRLEKMVRYRPQFLSSSLEESIKPKIKFFQDLGISSDGISKIISDEPAILSMSLNDNIIPSLSLLKSLLGSDHEVARVIRLAPRVLPANLENALLPNVEMLKSCGVPMERIRIVLTSFPNTFLLKPELVTKSVEKVNEMGIDVSSIRFIYAVTTIAKMRNEAWELKWQAFRSLGFSDSDVMTMFRKAPQAFSASTEKIKKIKELLLDTNKYTISSILNYPKSFQFSIEKRLMPRIQTLGNLESRGLIKDWPSLLTLCTLSDDYFRNRYISPYSGKVSDGCTIKSSGRSGQTKLKP